MSMASNRAEYYLPSCLTGDEQREFMEWVAEQDEARESAHRQREDEAAADYEWQQALPF